MNNMERETFVCALLLLVLSSFEEELGPELPFLYQSICISKILNVQD
uniref:Uncharacterized protein n=1 Tax=Setaria italica TaxID=4555 RepID=K3YF46_SETIT